MLDIKSLDTLKVRLLGNEYELTLPTRKQAVVLQELLKTEEGKQNSLQILGDFLVQCGMPADVCDNLQLGHFQLIVEHLMGAKKN